MPLSLNDDSPEPPGGRRSALKVLFGRNFAPYFLGNLASATGTWIQNIAQALLIFRLTGSTFLVALVTFAQFLGLVILAPWSGAAADKWDRRRLLMVTQVVSGLLVLGLAIITYIEAVNVQWVFGVALIVGFAKAFAVPPQQALVPSLVSRTDLQSAIALNSITYNLARAIGPVIGVALIASLGFAWAFVFNAGSYLFFAVALLVVDIKRQAPTEGPGHRLVETIRVVRDDRTMLSLLIAVSLVSVAVDPVTNLTPGFAVEIYGVSDTFAGYLTGAFGLGAAIAAGLVVARLKTSFRIIAWAMAATGLGMIGMGYSTRPYVGIGALLITGMAFITSVSLATTVVQLMVDDAHRGRIMALWGIAFLGIRPLASLVDGTVATLFGLRAGAIAMAIPVLIGAFYISRTLGFSSEYPRPTQSA